MPCPTEILPDRVRADVVRLIGPVAGVATRPRAIAVVLRDGSSLLAEVAHATQWDDVYETALAALAVAPRHGAAWVGIEKGWVGR